MITDWKLGLLALVALPLVAWAMERLGASMRRAATRGMHETGELSVVLSEAMDGRRIIKAYGLEAHGVERVDARSIAAQLAAQLPFARRCRAVADISWWHRPGRSPPAGRASTASSPSTPSHVPGGDADGAAAGAQPYQLCRSPRRQCRRRAHLRLDRARPTIVDRPAPSRCARQAAQMLSASRFRLRAGRPGAEGVTEIAAGQKIALVGPAAPARPRSSTCCCAFTTADSGRDRQSTARIFAAVTHRACAPPSRL